MSFKDIPKIELHLHLDGSVRPETIADMLKIDINKVKEETIAKEKCSDLNDYLTKFELPIKAMQTKENLKRITHELISDLKDENVIYAEIRFAPIKHIENLTLEEVVEAVTQGLKNEDVKTNLILCMMRDSSYEENLKIVELAKKYLNKGVVGLDLAGAEALYKTKTFEQLFKKASKEQIPFTIHAGEADGPSSINDAISFKASRIGHGIRAIEDEKTIKKIITENILLEICPTSNVQTNAVKTYENHPIKKLFDLGCKVSINTDNRTVSNVTLTKEYELLNKYLNFSLDEIIKINLETIKHTFLSEKEKQELTSLYLDKIRIK